MDSKHPSHHTRVSFDSSSYDEICIDCGATDQTGNGWGNLSKPCTNSNLKSGNKDDTSN